MADSRITINFTADTSGVESGTKRMAGDLDDVTKKLGDVDRAGQKTGTGVTREVDAIGTATDKTRQKVEKVPGALADWDTKSESRLKNVAKNVDEVTQSSGGLASNVSGQLSQAFTDFDGTATGAVNGVSNSLQGISGLIPGIGGAIGAGLAGLAGLIFGGIAKQADASKQQVEDAMQDMVDSGKKYLTEDFFNTQIKAILDDDNQRGWAKKWAAAINEPVSTVVAALAGVPDSVDQVTAAVQRANDKLAAEAEKGTTGTKRLKNEEIVVNNQLLEKIADVTDGYDTAAGKAKLYDQSTQEVSKSSRVATDDVKKTGDALNNLPDSKNITFDISDASIAAAKAKLEKALSNVKVDLNGTAYVQVRGGKALL